MSVVGVVPGHGPSTPCYTILMRLSHTSHYLILNDLQRYPHWTPRTRIGIVVLLEGFFVRPVRIAGTEGHPLRMPHAFSNRGTQFSSGTKNRDTN